MNLCHFLVLTHPILRLQPLTMIIVQTPTSWFTLTNKIVILCADDVSSEVSASHVPLLTTEFVFANFYLVHVGGNPVFKNNNISSSFV